MRRAPIDGFGRDSSGGKAQISQEMRLLEALKVLVKGEELKRSSSPFNKGTGHVKLLVASSALARCMLFSLLRSTSARVLQLDYC